ncbi:MAG: hypothetical protein V9F04_14885 [Dermatophilaceae bacterium]
MSMIAILAALLAFLGFGGVATSDVGTGSSTGTTLVAAPLERASLTWSGGFTGQPARTVVGLGRGRSRGARRARARSPARAAVGRDGLRRLLRATALVLVARRPGAHRRVRRRGRRESLAPLDGALRARDGA